MKDFFGVTTDKMLDIRSIRDTYLDYVSLAEDNDYFDKNPLKLIEYKEHLGTYLEKFLLNQLNSFVDVEYEFEKYYIIEIKINEKFNFESYSKYLISQFYLEDKWTAPLYFIKEFYEESYIFVCKNITNALSIIHDFYNKKFIEYKAESEIESNGEFSLPIKELELAPEVLSAVIFINGFYEKEGSDLLMYPNTITLKKNQILFEYLDKETEPTWDIKDMCEAAKFFEKKVRDRRPLLITESLAQDFIDYKKNKAKNDSIELEPKIRAFIAQVKVIHCIYNSEKPIHPYVCFCCKTLIELYTLPEMDDESVSSENDKQKIIARFRNIFKRQNGYLKAYNFHSKKNKYKWLKQETNALAINLNQMAFLYETLFKIYNFSQESAELLIFHRRINTYKNKGYYKRTKNETQRKQNLDDLENLQNDIKIALKKFQAEILSVFDTYKNYVPSIDKNIKEDFLNTTKIVNEIKLANTTKIKEKIKEFDKKNPKKKLSELSEDILIHGHVQSSTRLHMFYDGDDAINTIGYMKRLTFFADCRKMDKKTPHEGKNTTNKNEKTKILDKKHKRIVKIRKERKHIRRYIQLRELSTELSSHICLAISRIDFLTQCVYDGVVLSKK